MRWKIKYDKWIHACVGLQLLVRMTMAFQRLREEETVIWRFEGRSRGTSSHKDPETGTSRVWMRTTKKGLVAESGWGKNTSPWGLRVERGLSCVVVRSVRSECGFFLVEWATIECFLAEEWYNPIYACKEMHLNKCPTWFWCRASSDAHLAIFSQPVIFSSDLPFWVLVFFFIKSNSWPSLYQRNCKKNKCSLGNVVQW